MEMACYCLVMNSSITAPARRRTTLGPAGGSTGEKELQLQTYKHSLPGDPEDAVRTNLLVVPSTVEAISSYLSPTGVIEHRKPRIPCLENTLIAKLQTFCIGALWIHPYSLKRNGGNMWAC